MTKNLIKAVILRSRLKKKFNHNKNEKNPKTLNQQKNYYVKRFDKTKIEYFNNMNLSKVYDVFKNCKAKILIYMQDYKGNSSHKRGYDYEK